MRPKKHRPASLDPVPGKIVEEIILGATERQLKSFKS